MDTKISTIKRAVFQRDVLPEVTTFNIGSSPVRHTLSRVTTFNIDSNVIDIVEVASEPDQQIKHLFSDHAACRRQCMACVHYKRACTTVNNLSQSDYFEIL